MENNNNKQAQNTKRSILITNYRKKNNEDDPKKTIGDFFAFCGLIKAIEVQEEENKKDYFKAYLTFEAASSAEVAQLLNTAVIGHESEQIKVELIDTPAHHDAAPAPESPQNAPTSTPSGVIEKLLSLGYKLKDDTLHLAQQIDTVIRTNAVPVVQNAGVAIASHIPENIKEASNTALEVTAHKLQEATHIAKDISGNVLLNTSGLTEDLKNKGQAVAGMTTATIMNATGATVEAIKSAGGAISSHVPHSVEDLKTVGQAVATTGQVTLDVTTHTLHEVAEKTLHATPVPVQQGLQTAADVTTNTLKTVGAVVSNTTHLAYDITENKLHQIANTTIETSQVAAATIASVYEANKAPIAEAQATVANLVTAGGESIRLGGEVAAATVASVYEANKVPILEAKNTAQATVSNLVSVGGETLKQTGQTALNVATSATAAFTGIFSGAQQNNNNNK